MAKSDQEKDAFGECHNVARPVQFVPARCFGGSGGGLIRLSMLEVPTPEEVLVSVLEML